MSYNFSCPDWYEKIQIGQTPIPDLPYDNQIANSAVGIFNSLRVHDIVGQPRFGDVAGDWIRDIIKPVFGCINKKTRARFLTEAFILIPKKNAKTTSSAAMGVIWICLNVIPNAEGVIVGPTKDVANTCFKAAMNMIMLDSDLKKMFKIQEHLKTITHLITGATLVIKTFDMSIITGKILVFCILDELHVISKIKDAEAIIGQIRGGMITNPMALLIIITTQSTDPPSGAFKNELQYARGVRDGRITEAVSTLAVLYEFPEELQRDDNEPWKNSKYWPLVLPNLGRSISIDRLEQLFHKASMKGIEALQLWASQHLNIEIGLALHSDRWIGADFWASCADDCLSLKSLLDRSEVIVAGYDGGGMDDLSGLALTGRCKETRKWLSWFRAWAHPVVFERRKEIAARLLDFAADGDLIVCAEDNPTQDFSEICAILKQVQDAGLFPESNAIGLDSFGVSDLVDMLLVAEFSDDQLCSVPQGYKLSGSIRGLERRLKDRSYLHSGSKMMNWVVGNARATLRGNNIYIDKSVAGAAKIDPLVAGFNAYSLMSLNPMIAQKGSIDDFLSNPIMVC